MRSLLTWVAREAPGKLRERRPKVFNTPVLTNTQAAFYPTQGKRISSTYSNSSIYGKGM